RRASRRQAEGGLGGGGRRPSGTSRGCFGAAGQAHHAPAATPQSRQEELFDLLPGVIERRHLLRASAAVGMVLLRELAVAAARFRESGLRSQAEELERLAQPRRHRPHALLGLEHLAHGLPARLVLLGPLPALLRALVLPM